MVVVWDTNEAERNALVAAFAKSGSVLGVACARELEAIARGIKIELLVVRLRDDARDAMHQSAELRRRLPRCSIVAVIGDDTHPATLAVSGPAHVVARAPLDPEDVVNAARAVWCPKRNPRRTTAARGRPRSGHEDS